MAVLEEIFWQLNCKQNGIVINVENLSHLRFANDSIIFSQTKEDLEGIINYLDRDSRKIRSGFIFNEHSENQS